MIGTVLGNTPRAFSDSDRATWSGERGGRKEEGRGKGGESERRVAVSKLQLWLARQNRIGSRECFMGGGRRKGGQQSLRLSELAPHRQFRNANIHRLFLHQICREIFKIISASKFNLLDARIQVLQCNRSPSLPIAGERSFKFQKATYPSSPTLNTVRLKV